MSATMQVTNWSGVLLGIMCLLGIIGSMVWVAWSERQDRRNRAALEQELHNKARLFAEMDAMWSDDASSEEA